MAEKTNFEYGRPSNSEGPVTSTLTLDRVIWHNVVYHTSTSTYMPNFIKIEKKLWMGKVNIMNSFITNNAYPIYRLKIRDVNETHENRDKKKS